MKTNWIGYKTDNDFDETVGGQLHGSAAPYFRKRFPLKGEVRRAVLNITALGIFKAYINGNIVSEEYFAPGWTNYSKRILLKSYDVKKFLKEDNAISVCLGDGWYAGYLCNRGRNNYGNYPLELYARLEIEYENGAVEEIVTDETWKGGCGAIGINDFCYGEVYDARLPDAETSLPQFDDSAWQNVTVCEDIGDRLSVFDCEPVRIVNVLSSTRFHSAGAEGVIYNFGQNFSGVVRLTCRGERGAKVTIRHGELMDVDGSLYTANLRLAKATDTYILKGEGTETYTPSFTYHGFQYAEVLTEGDVNVLQLEGCVLSNDLRRTGTIAVDNVIISKLYENIRWGQIGNFVELPTDCPQRNERLGWSADTQVFSRTAMYNSDCEKFYLKQLMRIDDDRVGGKIADVSPYFGVAPFDSAGWRDVAVVVPFNLYEMYGNTDVIKRYKPMMDAFLDRQIETMHDYLWDKAYYGDWLNVDEETDPTVLATCFQGMDLLMLEKMYRAVGYDTDRIITLYKKVQDAFLRYAVSPDGTITGDSQTAYCVAFRAGFIDEQTAKRRLYKALERKDFHICSGFLGIRFILPVLCDVGLQDLAYKLIAQTTYPSWGYSIVNGATTVWERWNSYTVKDGFADKIMNSFNHYALGSCGEWMYEYMLGIKPTSPGFKSVRIQPYVDKTGVVGCVNGSFDSGNGKIEVAWKVDSGIAEVTVTKPEKMLADFCFDNVIEIKQDGRTETSFRGDARITKVQIRL